VRSSGVPLAATQAWFHAISAMVHLPFTIDARFKATMGVLPTVKGPTMKPLYVSVVAIAASTMLSVVPSALAQSELPPGALRITPDELRWGPGRVPGHEIAPLIGASNRPGVYVERVRFPANAVSQPHSHPEARSYVVISGTWYVGYGDSYDSAKLKALPPGSFYTEPANVTHFSLTKDEPVVVQISGDGPSATRFVDAGQVPR
jgi:quercetin dioxygenase-like cupin family protein